MMDALTDKQIKEWMNSKSKWTWSADPGDGRNPSPIVILSTFERLMKERDEAVDNQETVGVRISIPEVEITSTVRIREI